MKMLQHLWAVPVTPPPPGPWCARKRQETQQLGQKPLQMLLPSLIIWKLLQCVEESPQGVFPSVALFLTHAAPHLEFPGPPLLLPHGFLTLDKLPSLSGPFSPHS